MSPTNPLLKVTLGHRVHEGGTPPRRVAAGRGLRRLRHGARRTPGPTRSLPSTPGRRPQRTDRSQQPDHREDPQNRPPLPQLRQLSTLATPRLRHPRHNRPNTQTRGRRPAFAASATKPPARADPPDHSSPTTTDPRPLAAARRVDGIEAQRGWEWCAASGSVRWPRTLAQAIKSLARTTTAIHLD